MKKFATIGLSLSLLVSALPVQTAYALTSTNNTSEGTDISVKLSKFIGNKTAISIGIKGGYTIQGNETTRLSEGTSYQLKMENGSLALYANGTKITSFGSSVTFVPNTYDSGHLISLEGRTYLGTMAFSIDSGYIRPLNTLSYEDYLKGVVPSEMMASWNEEALKAQAISARTYSIKDIGKTVVDTETYQAYGGYILNTYTDKINRVVANTKSQVLTYNGALISAMYTSSNGGKVLSTANTYGSANVPYLQMKDDPYDAVETANPYLNWSYSVKKTQIDMTGKSLTSPSLWWGITTEADATMMTSLKAGMKNKTYGGYIDPKYDVKIVSIPELSFTTSFTATQRIDGHLKVNYYLKDLTTGEYVMENGQLKLYSTSVDRRAYDIRFMLGTSLMRGPYVKSVTSSATNFIVTGKGFGHGIGMSQYGANQMAKQGKTYREILAFYYPNTLLSTPISTDNPSSNEGGVVTPPITTPPTTTEPTTPETSVKPSLTNVSYSISPSNEVNVVYSIDKEATVKMELYNSSKVLVKKLMETVQKGGPQTQTFDLDNLPFGIYTAVITVTRDGQTVKEEASVQLNNVNPYWITLTGVTSLYEKPNSTLVSSVGPQSVKVIEKQDDWYKIVTWLGYKWIKPQHPIVPVSKKIVLTKNTSLYDSNSDTSKVSTQVGPQTVTAIGEWEGKEWYQINTWLGPKWINLNEPVKPTTFKIRILNTEKLYNDTSTSSTSPSSVGVQTLTAVDQKNGWFQVSTWLGPKWITPKGYVLVDDKKIKSDRVLTLYNSSSFGTGSKTTSLVGPQTLTYVENTGSWYKINTWLGFKWVNLG